MSERWLPPHKDLAKELVGDNTRTTEDTVTPPISDADLAILLDTLKETNPKLYLAVGLIALHGLRLSELATLEVRDGNKLFVGSIKKSYRGFQSHLFLAQLGKTFLKMYLKGHGKSGKGIKRCSSTSIV